MWATEQYSDDGMALEFLDCLGENELSEDIVKAFIWACIQKFVIGVDDDLAAQVDPNAFTDRQKQLAKAASFSGPYDNEDDALDDAKNLQGIVCCPKHLWTDENQPCWCVCLSN